MLNTVAEYSRSQQVSTVPQSKKECAQAQVAAQCKLWNDRRQSALKCPKNAQGNAMALKTFSLAALAIAGTAMSALAHHSFAMFDASKIVTLDGTVKEFQWTNPHAFIILTVEENSAPVQWAIEMNGPSGIARDGWRPKTLTPGMKVKVVIHPLHDGGKGGQYLAITLPDGKLMGNPKGRGPAQPRENPAP
jgi:hypothetical protein